MLVGDKKVVDVGGRECKVERVPDMLGARELVWLWAPPLDHVKAAASVTQQRRTLLK